MELWERCWVEIVQPTEQDVDSVAVFRENQKNR
jgi:hypothetical protein